jgi:surface polysaccharide O-acyltransferase-like enzyme
MASTPLALTDIEALVDATPTDRDRVVDLIRGVSILVVVLWHWTLSITQWSDGRLSMPNPIGRTSGLWLLTWVLQVMPLFFVVGGFSNLAGWSSLVQSGQRSPGRRFVRSRLNRLGRPVGAMVATWVVLDLVIRVVRPETPSVFSWGMVVFVPLWFLGTYGAITSLVPLTARLHRTAPATTLGLLAAIVVASDVVRFAGGVQAAGYVTTTAVWLFIHQLGYFWRDGSLTAMRRRGHVAIAVVGLAGLVGSTNIGVYPRSMVAVDGEWLSNMFPTTAPIAFLAVFQLGLVLLARPVLNRWLLRSRTAWRATVSVNAVAMTVFCWHMTALVAAIGMWNLLGLDLIGTPTVGWWLQRPIWLVVPAVVLVPIARLFWPIENRGRAA